MWPWVVFKASPEYDHREGCQAGEGATGSRTQNTQEQTQGQVSTVSFTLYRGKYSGPFTGVNILARFPFFQGEIFLKMDDRAENKRA